MSCFQAVIAARVDESGKSRELSVALANRSAVLVSLKAYHLALDDIRLAFEMGYPDELRFKLLERKAKILMLGKQFSDAQAGYIFGNLLGSFWVSTSRLNNVTDDQGHPQFFLQIFGVFELASFYW